MTILIIVGIIVLLGIIFASMYNSLVRLRNNRENAFADIDVQLKQRHDLIPQLVDTVKGYAAHEKDTLERVIQARNGAVSAKTIDEKIAAEKLDLPLGTVKSRIFFTRQRLQQELKDFV